MLTFILKKEWYEKIKSGEKTVEYREVKPYWERRILPFLFQEKPCCKLRLGYTNRYMTANITKIEMVDGNNTDLHINKPVYAIHLADVREDVIFLSLKEMVSHLGIIPQGQMPFDKDHTF